MTTSIANEIVVAIESATTDNPALRVGLELARLTNLALRLVHVACDGETLDLDPLDDYLQATAPSVPVNLASVAAADIVSGLVAELTPRSLVILKSTNASRWSGKASVAEHVLDAFPGLVAMVGPELGTSTLAGPILVALDGSSEAERAVPVAALLSESAGTTLVATRVVPSSADASTRQSAMSYLDTVVDSLANARPVSVVSNDPIAAILATAVDESASMIVLSSHGDRASERATISRTSMGLVHSATVPVLMVGPSR